MVSIFLDPHAKDMEQLTDLGYAVIDADNERTWVYVPPAGAAQAHV